jgi:hypothetical protein
MGLLQPSGGNGSAIVSGFNTHTLPVNDDGSTPAVALPFPIVFYGQDYDHVYVNNNGNITMDSPMSQFTPESLDELSDPMIAPFWADVDTRGGAPTTYGQGTISGHLAFGVNWLNAGCYPANQSVKNSFQLLLIQRSDLGQGDFDIEFNYGPMTWENGAASGGNSRCLFGTPARAGYTNGAGISYELPGSGIASGLLDSNLYTSVQLHSAGSSQLAGLSGLADFAA